jgi:uncharacterized protein YqhQ
VQNRTLDLLAQADAVDSLPRLGGMARADGVVIVSRRFWAMARIDGALLEGTMPSRASFAQRIPLLRGLVRLALALSPLVRAGGVARSGERWLLCGAALTPVALAPLSTRLELAGGLALTLVLVAWLCRGRTLNLHGAEHRAIAAVEARELLSTWRGAARPSRFARRCGTNLAVLALGVSAVLYATVPGSGHPYLAAPLALGALAVTMEMWRLLEESTRRVAALGLLPGLLLQRLTTREPTLAETRLALTAAASVLRRELE